MNTPISVNTPLGNGHAIFIIDNGLKKNSCWVVVINSNGLVKHFDSDDIIISTNYTYKINSTNNSFN